MASLHVYAGAYTQDLGWVKGMARGIALYLLDSDTGKMARISEIVSENPSFVTIHPSGKFLYSVNEAVPDGKVSAFAIQEDGALRLLNSQPSLGGAPCFLSLDSAGKIALIANYSGGNFVMFPIGSDGTLGTACENVNSHSLTPKKVPAPKAHSIRIAPGGKYAVGCDLGLDQVILFKLDLTQGRLFPHAVHKMPAGSEPRHLDFHPNGKYLYLISELAGTITVFDWESDAGQLRELQTISVVPADYAGPIAGGGVQVHASGNFVYATVRGPDSIAIFGIDFSTGLLTLRGHESTRGKTPRSLTLTPAGDLLLAVNQNSNSVAAFRVDGETGKLTCLAVNDVPTPASLVFAR